MSDTPETNAAQFGTGRVSVSFARKLERERDEALETLHCLLAVIGLTPIAGNKQALQEAVDLGFAVLQKRRAGNE